jgi:uncharacterized protein (TIGR03382 family)
MKRTLFVAASLCACSAAHAQVFTANLVPSNNSGVTGQAMFTFTGNSLTVNVTASGLVPNQPHPNHIHGFANGMPSVLPPPTADTNGNGIIETPEAIPYIGPVLIDLGNLVVGPTGTVNLNQTVPLTGQLGGPPFSLLNRAFELHGLVVDLDGPGPNPAAYNPDIPVAGGIIIPAPATLCALGLAALGLRPRRR